MQNTKNNNNTGVGRSGAKAPPALDPRNPALVQPFKRLVEEGFIRSIKIEFTPSGFTCGGVPDQRMIALPDSALQEGREYPLGILSALADKHNLIPLKGKAGKKATGDTKSQPLPAKTLVKEDLSKTPQELMARAIAVAKACGGASLVGRVRTSGAFNGKVTITFKQWWDSATAVDRVKALVIPSKLKEFTSEDISRFSGPMPCPFRGIAEFRVHEDNDEEEEEEVGEPKVRPAPSSPKQNGI